MSDRIVIPKEQLTAFERWELSSFDTGSGEKTQGGAKKYGAPPATKELDTMRQQQRDQGQALSREAGYAAGMQQAQVEVMQIHTLLQNMQLALNQLDEQVAQSLLDLSLEIARKMVGEVLQVKREVILKIVSDAINSLPHFNHNAHLILHPDDADLVQKQMGEQLAHAGWKIFTETQITRGGCRVETSHSEVNATVEARWQHIVGSIGQDKSWQA